MPESKWLKAINIARKHPAALVGRTKNSFLQLAVTSTLRAVYQKGFLDRSGQCTLKSSLLEYQIEIGGGKLNSRLSELMKLGESWNIIQSLWELDLILDADDPEYYEFTRDSSFRIPFMLSPLMVAGHSMLGIRDDNGFWAQIFRDGWPITRPVNSDYYFPDCGFVLAAHVQTSLLFELPFQPEDFISVIPDELSSKVTVNHRNKSVLPPLGKVLKLSPLNPDLEIWNRDS